ncbi:acyl carrier protein [Bradyrhizobium diazoefficiens]|nr:acyl carrier protein [Bradyrhizobium diazoefficiens]MBR0963731.1 acyl carrier protein [Bradyrhizobium diazoefficiens]MBR0977883.1 acyl carrier protein [Bradyrhizobium diazoefficiens]MBR1007393.1 acyl carrier protein [Bradyrhizobium diazoefficiens]MBR1012766.1 acyl carrier protein [Bradyrhizobium diazoefficiens]MBR1052314.1 acyl carrier protein [Bradyrhizobium diazoefficiens]
MTSADTLSEVSDIIRDVLDAPDLPISRETQAIHCEGWDSVNHINIIISVESRFGIKINTAEIEGMKNVGELVDAVDRKRGAR